MVAKIRKRFGELTQNTFGVLVYGYDNFEVRFPMLF